VRTGSEWLLGVAMMCVVIISLDFGLQGMSPVEWARLVGVGAGCALASRISVGCC